MRSEEPPKDSGAPPHGDRDWMTHTLHDSTALACIPCAALVVQQGRIVYVNSAAIRLLGATDPQRVQGKPLEDFVSPSQDAPLAAILDDGCSGWCEDERVRNEVRRLDGERLMMESAVRRIDYQGVSSTLIIGRDVTQLERAEHERLQSDARFRAVYERSPIGIALVDRDHGFLGANANYCELVGYSEAELRELGIEDVTHHDDLEHNLALQGQLARGEIPSFTLEKRFIRKDGAVVWGLLIASLIRDDEGAPLYFLGQVLDITARKHAEVERAELEAQLHHARNLEALGRLAGGVAHDFNNLLTGILGNAALLKEEMGAEHPLQEYVEEVLASVDRATGLTRQLLSFGSRQMVQPRVVDVNLALNSLHQMLIRTVGEHVTIHVSLDPTASAIEVEPAQLDQVLINLVTNARDAMPDGGGIWLETGDVLLDPVSARRLHVPPGVYVRVRVRDDGPGMDEDTRSRVFEPYFTTKEEAGGAGLGLSSVYGIITQHGGGVWVTSASGGGATFDLFLPARDHEEVADTPESPNGGIVGGSETLLVVEDEASVRRAVARLLERLGYRVLQAEDGRAALEVARAHEEPIDLLLTDVIMPNMNGRQLAEALKRVRPGLNVLYMSGYPGDVIAPQGMLPTDVDFIAKPYEPARLARRIRDILDGP